MPMVNILAKKRNRHVWKQERLRKVAVTWLLEHRDVALSVCSPGARRHISEFEEYFLK